jgi:hypothetical protein
MQVRVYLVGWMKAIAGAVMKNPLELHDGAPRGDAPDDDDDDRDTWPEAGLATTQSLPLAEVRIDLAGAENELDGRAQDLLAAIEREVKQLSAGWNCSVRVTPQAKD